MRGGGMRGKVGEGVKLGQAGGAGGARGGLVGGGTAEIEGVDVIEETLRTSQGW